MKFELTARVKEFEQQHYTDKNGVDKTIDIVKVKQDLEFLQLKNFDHIPLEMDQTYNFTVIYSHRYDPDNKKFFVSFTLLDAMLVP